MYLFFVPSRNYNNLLLMIKRNAFDKKKMRFTDRPKLIVFTPFISEYIAI